MKNKWLMAALLAAGTPVLAEEQINYNFLEIGYGYLDLSEEHADGFYLDGAFELTDRFYLGGYYDNKSNGPFDLDRYGVNFGFHTNGTNNTDFYSELSLGRLDLRFDDSDIYGLKLGTRTAVNEKFELITKAGYTHIDKASDGYFTFGLQGLFKLNENHAISAEAESDDGELGLSLGFRFQF
ncbi:hypothetical protein ACFODZ_02285 [Marinicella sediminis]|uniref:Outer membrane protein beta-barrel domain-containing protein n=1 Tax=Marinicella sediminis TaxID=1792834 RepID=A0ABV7J863_9GAMM|nr:hypothetical protein [Marinicella sediminis]